MDATHNPSLKSWVASANQPGQDFPIQNLPFGIFSRAGEAPRGGVAIGEMILDVRAAISAGLLAGAAAEAAAAKLADHLRALAYAVINDHLDDFNPAEYRIKKV